MTDITFPDWKSCPLCDQALRSPHLLGACASVGIERGMTTAQMVDVYIRQHHEGHR